MPRIQKIAPTHVAADLSPTQLYFLSKGERGFSENQFWLFELLHPHISERDKIADMQDQFLATLTDAEREAWARRAPVEL